MLKSSLLLLLFTCISKISSSQLVHPQTKQEIIGVCDKFMTTFKEGKYDSAFDRIKPYSAIEDEKLDTLASVITKQMAEVTRAYGKVLSYEEISEKDAKNSLIQLIYLAKYDKFFLKFTFTLYNNGKGWTIAGFDYNQKVDDIF
jgi:hypothetical protein